MCCAVTSTYRFIYYKLYLIRLWSVAQALKSLLLFPLRAETMSLFITLQLRVRGSGSFKKETRLISELYKVKKVTF